jgi:hypothetical protein
VNPSREQIERRAYEFWEGRGRPWGTAEEDWLNAERELATQSDGILTKVARELGSAVGSVVASLNAAGPLMHRHHKHRES